MRAVLLLPLLLAGCAAAPAGLWPPRPGERAHRIVVSIDAWHSMIGFPQPDGRIEEWGYAEKAWYYEKKQGVSGAIRSLFWPTASVVEITLHRDPWHGRTRQPPARAWEIELSDAGLRALRGHLESSLAAAQPFDASPERRWFDGLWDYHLFHNCHHYTARALWQAGLPMHVAGCLTRIGLERDLKRVLGDRRR